ncbi:hypothetical protein AAMO2058_000761700 [Amorphochlora amoebiformis]
MMQPSAEKQRENAMKEAMKAKYRDLQDDEMPVITNLAEFAHEEGKIKEMIRREHMGEDAGSVRTGSGAGGGRASVGVEKLDGKKSKRLEDVKADAMEKDTGKHAFRRKRTKSSNPDEDVRKKKKKKKKKKIAASSLLSFDNEDA